MLKKHLTFVILMVMAIASVNAGTWKMHNYYVTDRIQNVIDAGDKVYYQNSGRLYQFDKATTSTVALGRQNILSDNVISNIYYDWENKLLFIAYSNSNIDVIDEAGNVTNISKIKDIVSHVRNYSVLDGELQSYADKSILDITFADGIAYVSIGYGYATIDESTMMITKFYDLGSKITVNSVCSFNGKILIVANVNCYYGDPGEEDPLKNYQKIPNPNGSSSELFFRGVNTYPIDDHSIFMLSTAQSKLYNYDFSSGTPQLTAVVNAAPTCVQKTPTGFIANFAGQKYYYTIDPTGKIATKVGSTIGFATSDPNGDGTVWINDANGIHISGTSTNYKMNSLTMTMPHWLKYSAAMDKLYVATPGPNAYDALGQIYANVINTYDGSTWSVLNAISGANTVGYSFVFDPLDPYTFVRNSWSAGIFKVTRDVLKTTYKSNNAMIGSYKPEPAFDNYGNLWAVSSWGNASCPVAVLPRANYEKTTPVISDWFQPSGLLSLNTGSTQRSRFLVAKKNNVKIFSDCDYPTNKSGLIYCWDNDNQDPTVDNYRLSKISHFIDQDNRQVDWTYLLHLEEDKDGLIWVGHVAGLFVFDPDVAFDEFPKAIRPFASKFSEGQGFLCEGYSVFDIGIDRDNNKWLASNDGVYFVSPDGSEVYNHFTIDNSDIPSNLVYSVECDTVNNRVYIYTDNGFAEYVTSGDAASLNFDNVYTFPNPVEPDFTGMVKIANLMDNSYVTITDREGNVIKQLGPVMGSALWDASGANGERVPTGIYNVYAAQGGQPAITGTPHATIMVIK